MRIIRFLAGLALIPCAITVTLTAFSLVQAGAAESDAAIPPATLALASGFALWLIAYFALPRPVRSYVLAHELTHALWGAIMGARVSRIKVSKSSGSVTLSKSNFFITLAPYFFPLYTVLAIAIYRIMAVFLEMDGYFLWWMGLIGFTWSFHFTFTIAALMQRQPDISEYGHVFSYVLIYLLNVAGVTLWIVLVSPATFEQTIGYLAEHWTRLIGRCALSIAELSQ